MRILFIDTDRPGGGSEERALCKAGFSVDRTADFQHARIAMETTRYSLFLLDLDRSHGSSFELLVSLGKAGGLVPLLVLSMRDIPAEKAKVLDLGADDYLCKPCDLTELVSRVRALLRRAQGRASERVTWRDISVDFARKSVTRGGRPLDLTAREWALFELLLSRAGSPQSSSEIAQDLYGWRDEIESNAIAVHVANLRKKLGEDVIRTVRGFGYVMDDVRYTAPGE
jgi:two-component system response regulator QseB